MLQDKYRLGPGEAKAAAAFLLPILDFDPQRRATAQDCLAHPWLADAEEGEEQGEGEGEVDVSAAAAAAATEEAGEGEGKTGGGGP